MPDMTNEDKYLKEQKELIKKLETELNAEVNLFKAELKSQITSAKTLDERIMEIEKITLPPELEKKHQDIQRKREQAKKSVLNTLNKALKINKTLITYLRKAKKKTVKTPFPKKRKKIPPKIPSKRTRKRRLR